MRSLIPKYSYRGMGSKLPSLGDKVGVAHPSKSACYSGGDLPPGTPKAKLDQTKPDTSSDNTVPPEDGCP
jgi:hypothetical protein